MAVNLKKLNKEQKEAVVHKDGPLLIVAGAGTGKTTVITQRIAYLIEKELAKPEEILAVTFTEKAAGEMEERADKMLPFGYVDLWISTFHSFCERVLRDYALDIGLPANFKILDQTGAWLLIRQNLDKFNLNYYKPLGNPTKFIQALISHFSHCKDQEIYPKEYLDYAESLKTRDDCPEDSEVERIKEIASAYHIYQKILLENSTLDFGDLINYCLKLFKTRPLILKRFREKFKYILVDEFQDTNLAQYELIKLLAESRPDRARLASGKEAAKNNLTVCADDDQAIYRWRGASFNNILQFKRDFPKAKEVFLIVNYRSGQNILDLAYKFIKANDPDRLEFISKINKKLVAAKTASAKTSSSAKTSTDKSAGKIEHLCAKTLDQEVGLVIKKILEILKKDKAANYNDFAILLRANDSAIPFIKGLERAGLPYQFLASRGLYAKPIILDVISYFKLLDNYHESPAVYRILNLPFLEIPIEDIIKLTQYTHRKTKSLFEAIEELPLIPGISLKSQEKINFLLSLVKKHSLMAREKSVLELLLSFMEDSGYLKYLIDKDDKPASANSSGGARESIDLLNQFLKRVKTFEELTIEPTLKNFMEEINMELESGEQGKLEFDPEAGPDMIRVMTVHGAKGLEFKYVFLSSLVDKRFPTIERKDLIELPEALIKDIKPKGDVHLQEERRLFYVGMTRAKKELYFTSSEDYGGQTKKKLSRFLIELGYKDSLADNTKTDLIRKKDEIVKREKFSPAYLPEYFSFSQLAAFEKCPLQYKFAFILKVPIKSKAVFSFGKTIHNTFYEFLKTICEISGTKQSDLFGTAKKTEKTDKFLDFGKLAEMYEKNWIDEWYESKSQKEEYYKKGKKIIKDFYEKIKNNLPKVLVINKEFALEMPFRLKIGDSKIFGVIDRIDEAEGGVVIYDYKTGKAKEKLDSDGKQQLLLYQIAAEEVFNVKPKELKYFYVEDGTEAAFLGTEKDKEGLKGKFTKEIEEIKNSNFKATPGWQCAYCDFKDICDFRER